MVRAQNVGKPFDEPIDDAAEPHRLCLLHAAPCMRKQPARQRGIAIGHCAVDLEAGAGPDQTVAQGFVVTDTEALRGAVPQGGERTRGALAQQPPHLPFKTQHVMRHALGFIALGDIPQQAIDEPGQGLHAVVVGAVDQHDRKVIAQGREIAVTRQKRRAQRRQIDRIEAGARPPARQVKRNLRLQFGFHEHIRDLKPCAGGRHSLPAAIR